MNVVASFIQMENKKLQDKFEERQKKNKEMLAEFNLVNVLA